MDKWAGRIDADTLELLELQNNIGGLPVEQRKLLRMAGKYYMNALPCYAVCEAAILGAGLLATLEEASPLLVLLLLVAGILIGIIIMLELNRRR